MPDTSARVASEILPSMSPLSPSLMRNGLYPFLREYSTAHLTAGFIPAASPPDVIIAMLSMGK